MDEKSAGGHRIFQLHELEELWNEAYENHRVYKEKTKTFHDKHISRKKLILDKKYQRVQLEILNSALHERQPMIFISLYFCTLIYRTCKEKSLISKKKKEERKNTCCKISG
ncbi:unnamed protein product [Spirodela intermedia]|uniref:Uncharacterized protein n=1 Tax=Spirodela intermedia TaxID=51605 RepID=A0A7I8KVL9_SPIIN|nr:unnamed protein product [Spirodela intermedia]